MDRRTRSPVRRVGRFLAAAGILAFAGALIAPTAGAAPKGNNGTVKVDGGDLTGNANEPHVSCVFNIAWFGFDETEVTSTVMFAAQPPTGSEVLLTDTETFTGSGPGGNLDHSQSYDLTTVLAPYTPQPNQGFHVKLTVETPGTQGGDTKHKTFWVGPCGTPPNPPTPVVGSITLDKVLAGTGAPTTDPSFTFTITCEDPEAEFTSPVSIKASDAVKTVASNVTKGTACTIAETSVAGATTTWSLDGGAAQAGTSIKVTVDSSTAAALVATNTYAAEVLGEEVTQQPQAQAQVEAEQLARTGSDSGMLAVTGLALVLGGLALVLVGKRFESVR